MYWYCVSGSDAAFITETKLQRGLQNIHCTGYTLFNKCLNVFNNGVMQPMERNSRAPRTGGHNVLNDLVTDRTDILPLIL